MTDGQRDASSRADPRAKGLGARFFANVRTALAVMRRPPREGESRSTGWGRGRLALIATAVLTILFSMSLVDSWWHGFARGLPDVLVSFFKDITGFGRGAWFLYPLGFTLLAIAVYYLPGDGRPIHPLLERLAVRLGFLFAAIALPGLVVSIVKRLIGRARPSVAGDDPWAYQLLVWRADHASLPSGHSTTAFAAAVAVGALWPGLRPLVWTYAVAIGLSRMIILAHHPSDVIAGALCGAVGALWVRDWFARRELGFSRDSAGRVQMDPPLSWREIVLALRKSSAP